MSRPTDQRAPRLRIGLRTKLLLAASILLLIPLLGVQYVRELERLLLSVQEQGLVATARAVGTALNDRPGVFLSGEVYPFALAHDTDLRIENLTSRITLDGLTRDWDEQPVATHTVGSGLGSPETRAFSAKYRIGRFGNYVYALFEVSDPSVLLRDPDRDPLTSSDHVQISVVTVDEEFLRFILNAPGSGRVAVALIDPDGNPVPDTRVRGWWRLVPGGYIVELRLPRSLIGPRLGFAVANVDDPETREQANLIGTSDTQNQESLGAVLIPSPEVSEIVKSLGRTRGRIWVLDRNRRVVAQAGALTSKPLPIEQDSSTLATTWEMMSGRVLRPILRLAVSEPNEQFQDMAPGTFTLDGPEIRAALSGKTESRWRLSADSRVVILSAAHPVWSDDRVVGAVLAEETTNDVLAVRNRAFEKLFAALLATYLGGAATLLVFATRLSLRIRKLRDETDLAIDEHGRVMGDISGSTAGDELGDLSRTFSGILARLKQYTGYLENLSGRLSHELRTPYAVVRSSMDNLKLIDLPDDARVYVQRAEEGLSRLTAIFTRMSEATRLEQSLQSVEREQFDLAKVVSGCVHGYRIAYPERNFELETPEGSVALYGAPELIAQMLDKLITNAVEFSKPPSPILVRLRSDPDSVTISVLNEGSTLPESMQGQLFESMVSIRPKQSTTGPHLGMGLYIVRLIAQVHGAHATARNRDDTIGVEVRIRFPSSDTANVGTANRET